MPSNGEVRMLIDGQLVESASGKRFENINPATEEVLGEVADASAEDMRRAIAAARLAFDDTDWSTNHALRKRCLEQLQAALESEREEYPRGAGRRGRYPADVDLRRPAGLASRGRVALPGSDDRRPSRGSVRSHVGEDGDAHVAPCSKSPWAWWAPSCRGTIRSK